MMFRHQRSKPRGLTTERCEDRRLLTMIFVFNGNSFHDAKPNALTANAAAVLGASGNQVIQLATPAINTPGSVAKLATSVAKIAHGQTVGLVGFSAGGALALRIAASPTLKVSAVLDYYGVPDVRAYLTQHHNTQPIAGLAPFRPKLVARLSGAIATPAHVVAAFGQNDPHVQPLTSAADLRLDDPSADVYTYQGGHGVAITASRPALDDFLAHLG